VVVALDFTPNAAHAPIFTAVRKGLDRKHGVRIVIRAPGSAPDTLKLLAAGRVDIGVLDIQDLGLARERGADLVGIAGLVQRPLGALITQADVHRPRDLEGRRVGVSGLPSDPAFVRAIVEHDGGRFDRLKLVTIGFDAVPNLLEHNIDAVPAFWNAEGVALRVRGARINEFRADAYGAPRYPEVLLIAARRTLERRRAAVANALRAIRDGAFSVLSDPAPAVKQISAAGGADEKLVRAQLAAVSPAFRPPLALDRAALGRWASWAARIGILHRPPDIGRAFVFDLLGGTR